MSRQFPRIRKTAPTMTVLRTMYQAGASREFHGYELAKKLRSHQSAYAIFRKLESHGLVSSRWAEVSGRRRRYYRLTGLGIDFCREMLTLPDTAGNTRAAPT